MFFLDESAVDEETQVSTADCTCVNAGNGYEYTDRKFTVVM